VRLQWLKGKIARDLGQLDQAEKTLEEVREILAGWNLGLDAAFASLDLAFVHGKSGNRGRLQKLLHEVIPIFESRGLSLEARMARLAFERSR
jgi:hypothetical protein